MFKVKELLLTPELFENPIFRIHLRCFQLYGYVASEEQRQPGLALVRCCVFTASIWLSCALMFTRNVLALSYEQLSDGATNWATAVQYFAVSIATMNAFAQRERVVVMLRGAHADLQRLMLQADAQELELLLSTQRYVRSITLLLWVPSVVAGLLAWLDCIYRTIFLPQTVFNSAAVRRGEAQPILLYKLYPFGQLCDNFIIGYLGPWYALFLGVSTIPLWHTFVSCLMKYVTFKQQLLNRRVRQMNVQRLTSRRIKPAELNYWRLKLCATFVEEQQQIRSFVHQIQQLICVPVMADFIIFSVLMCFLLFALMMGMPSKIDYFFIFIYLFVMAGILWLYHWHATLIVECQNELQFAIYDCNWYTFGLPVQKMLQFIMMDAQRPLVMRALLVDLNLRTFLDIMRGAYSYFNILRSTQKY
ncbi:odorant receptor 56a [Drosophila busckii]|uniref:odorant receptor 56a n=1 Tax=Drosophila busckii TaxID=30019 RepID=UPI00083EE919|nr:odorant receptor 56a [Drosophila busckii]